MRLVNRVASLLLALVLLAGGLLVVAEVIVIALDRPSLVVDRAGWYGTLTTTRLGQPEIRAAAVGVAVLGLLILIGQLRRWTPDRLPTGLADGWHLQRRSVERRLATAADTVPGVTTATARLRRRGTVWRAQIRAIGDASARPAVETAVRRELDRLAAPATEHVGVDLVRGGNAT